MSTLTSRRLLLAGGSSEWAGLRVGRRPDARAVRPPTVMFQLAVIGMFVLVTAWEVALEGVATFGRGLGAVADAVRWGSLRALRGS